MCCSSMGWFRKRWGRMGEISHLGGILGKGSDHEEKCAASCYGLLCLVVRGGGFFTRSVTAIRVRTNREGFYIRAYHRPKQRGSKALFVHVHDVIAWGKRGESIDPLIVRLSRRHNAGIGVYDFNY